MLILTNILTVLLVILGIGVILLVTLQTPKNEGFGGVTNPTGGGFRGKAGLDEMLSTYTRIVGITWFVIAFVLAVIHARMPPL
jgi:protein translocase SecG subunit